MLQSHHRHHVEQANIIQTACVSLPFLNLPAEDKLVVQAATSVETVTSRASSLAHIIREQLHGSLVFEQRATGGGAGRLRQVLVAWRRPRNPYQTSRRTDITASAPQLHFYYHLFSTKYTF